MTDNMKVLIAYYVPTVQRFRIPRGLDLNDETKVKEYWVRRGILHIKFVDGSFKHINPYYDYSDEKTPCEETIETDDEDDEEHESNVDDESADETKDKDEDSDVEDESASE
jgi:hypothetical protein